MGCDDPSSPDAKVSLWPPVIVCGVLALAGLYMMFAPSFERVWLPGRAGARVARSKEHPSFRDHVADLHGQAQAIFDTLNPLLANGRARFTSTNPVNLGPAATREFTGHFPQEAATLKEWNAVAIGFPEAVRQLSVVTEQLVEHVLPSRERGELPTQLLQRIGTRYYKIENAAWTHGDDGRLNIRFPPDVTAWCVALHPPASENDDFGRSIRTALEQLPTLPEALDVQRREAEFTRLRPILDEQMREVIRTHNPGGHCDKCP